ncbi:hypothetical protein KP004_01765 [Geomonas oryzisoli]|uniref:Vitamin K epoxide reductase domain-containing protein n=1 Tax=Geomonas oryzisoli TaxID=2847992 RepID=A0ABX8J7Y6_9BACT|nr:hypothetical protein [Geomonas oryzisoli]QWV93943.1 hypothetical protein KP004_01765 [Geomonas oryzisoli]
MILDPFILALLVSSLLISIMTLYACGHGIVILRRWDITSGSELQLVLERRTYLISTVVRCLLAFQLASLFLYLHTADSMYHLFTGAMCAAGTLSAHWLGYPTLLLKLASFFLAGIWLILNHADEQGYDYPLIRPKYLLLLLLAPMVTVETVAQAGFFAGLQPDIITSCCGSLFNSNASGIAAGLASPPPLPMLALFYTSTAMTLGTGIRFCLRNTGGYLFAGMSATNLVVTLVAVVSVISLYFYELPSHHCPFCLLQKEYGFAGYPVYILLLAAAVSGVGVGALHPFRGRTTLSEILPPLQRKLAVIALTALVIFTGAVTWQIVVSNLSLRG